MRFKGAGWEELLDAFDIIVTEPPEVEWSGVGPQPELEMVWTPTDDGNFEVSFPELEDPAICAYWDAVHQRNEAIDEARRKALADFLHEAYETTQEKRVARAVRKFIRALHQNSKKHDYYSPVWKALLKIEDNHTLFRCVGLLLPDMWS